jgi:hypothetical protein
MTRAPGERDRPVKLPVFLSHPQRKTPEQEKVYTFLRKTLLAFDLKPKTVDTPYPTKAPLLEVRALAETCAGGVVLGFARRPYGDGAGSSSSATPWNHLEAGMLFGLGLPLLIFRDRTVDDGIFDANATGDVVYEMPEPPFDHHRSYVIDPIRRWREKVELRYYHGNPLRQQW